MRTFQPCPFVLHFTLLLASQLCSDTYGYYGDTMHRLGQMTILPNPLSVNSKVNTPDIFCEQDYTTEEIVSSFPSSKRSSPVVRVIPVYVPLETVVSPTIASATGTTILIASTAEQPRTIAEISETLTQLSLVSASVRNISSDNNDISDDDAVTTIVIPAIDNRNDDNDKTINEINDNDVNSQVMNTNNTLKVSKRKRCKCLIAHILNYMHFLIFFVTFDTILSLLLFIILIIMCMVYFNYSLLHLSFLKLCTP